MHPCHETAAEPCVSRPRCINQPSRGGSGLVFSWQVFILPLILSGLSQTSPIKNKQGAGHPAQQPAAHTRGTFSNQTPKTRCSRRSPASLCKPRIPCIPFICTPRWCPSHQGREDQAHGTPLTYLTTGSGMASALAGTWTPFSHSCLQGSART